MVLLAPARYCSVKTTYTIFNIRHLFVKSADFKTDWVQQLIHWKSCRSKRSMDREEENEDSPMLFYK